MAPFTAACFGPVTTMAQCMALYPTCGTGFYTINVTGGAFIDYDLDCPCFGMNGVFTYNQMTPTSTPSVSPPLSSPLPPGSPPPSPSPPAGEILGGLTAGQTYSTECIAANGTGCAADGTSSYITRR